MSRIGVWVGLPLAVLVALLAGYFAYLAHTEEHWLGQMAGICGTLALVLLTAVYMAHTSRPTVATRGFARSGLSKSARMCPGS